MCDAVDMKHSIVYYFLTLHVRSLSIAYCDLNTTWSTGLRSHEHLVHAGVEDRAVPSHIGVASVGHSCAVMPIAARWRGIFPSVLNTHIIQIMTGPEGDR